MTSRPLRLAIPLLALLLVACGSMGSQRTPREQALYDYVSAVRWSDFDVARGFVDPDVLAANPVTDLEMERYRQFQVSGYQVKSVGESTDERFTQVVEIRIVNRNTQVERIIIDRQQWRWDAERKRWWLVSGLPDLESR